MGALDTGFGCALIATWFASILLGVAFAQAFDYFRMSENDTKLRKGLVVTVMVLCLSALGAEYAVIYLPTVTFWGDVASLSEESYASPVYSSCNATIALIVNTYLISRFYSVSKNIIVTLVLLVMNLFAAIMTCVPPLLGGGPGHPTTVAGLKNLIPIITTWAIANAVTDLLIALSLVWALRRMKTSFKDTDRLLRRVMILSVQNGCTTALASIGAMIGSLVMPFSSISVLFTYMLGPLYLLTLLSNLNLRGSSKSGSRTWTSSRNHTWSAAPSPPWTRRASPSSRWRHARA
ncbi:hypothetical protein C8R46DRAFT_1099581, partial [Mycena filopes]